MAAEEDSSAAWERAPCGLLTTDPAGVILRVNRTFCEWIGTPAEELLGRRFASLLTIGSKLFHSTHWSPLLQLQGSVSEVGLELVGRARVLPVLVNAVQREGGERLRNSIDIAVFVASDRRTYERELLAARRRAEDALERERAAQEELRQREREFRALADNSPDFIERFDRERRRLYVNPAGQRLLAEGVALEEHASLRADAVDAAFAGEERTLEVSVGAGGVMRTYLARVVPERSLAGTVQTVLVIAHDVTALRAQEREAQARAKLAEQFVGIVSHDLRNPLGAVSMGVEVLRRKLTGSEARTLERVWNAVTTARRLIDDLLDFTQARLGGGVRVNVSAADVHALAAAALDEIRLAEPGRTLVHKTVGEGTGTVDPGRVAQVLTNLVRNALAYGNPDAPVTVTTIVADDTLELTVHNDGAPIPPELQERIFNPMQRGEHGAGPNARSVGLGLYIVKQIAAAHGGGVVVRSTAAEGTTFRAWFPRSQPGPAAQARQPPPR